MSGKLIVIDGLDGSGKSTQAERVYRALREVDERLLLISYPDYKKPSSTLVRMYLSGEFSENADDVNAYAASSFYAVDRYASYMLDWKQKYEAGWTILATRYTTSNAIHQMEKLPETEWDAYLDWLSDYEYEKLGLPAPDMVLFLDMPRAIADALVEERCREDAVQKDIHEKNRAYLQRCQKTAAYAAQKLGWQMIPCAKEGKPLPMEAVTAQIMEILKKEFE